MSDCFDFFSQNSLINDCEDIYQSDCIFMPYHLEESSSSANRIDLTFKPIQNFDILEQKNQNQSTLIENGIEILEKKQENEIFSQFSQFSVVNDPDVKSEVEEEFSEVKIFPKETKNFYKNQITGFQKFIRQSAPSLRKDTFVNQLLKLKAKDRCNERLQQLISKSPKMQGIAAFYFGQYAWSINFLKNNRVGLGSFCRINKLLYKRRSNKKKIQ